MKLKARPLQRPGFFVWVGGIMNPKNRIAVNLPLTELWDDSGPLDFVRGRPLTADDIRDRLRTGAIQFVVAQSGQPLEWITAENCFTFWKAVVQSRVVPPDAVRIERPAAGQPAWPLNAATYRLEDYPDENAFHASEWVSAEGRVIVLLEMEH
ncbi:MAG TPA: hypothetical protein VM452_02070 [Caulifigura sp.]|nr:hypothetical protein [Caulifigura sp.]